VTVREIATIGHPVLRERAREVTAAELRTPETQRLIDDMIETMRDARGAGLAANQVHETVRVAVIEVDHNPRYPYKPPIPLTIVVNPVIEPLDDESVEINEGCLSVPDLRGTVERHVNVRVRYLDREGVEHDEVKRGLTAGTFQHEVDHLDGVLFVDRVRDPCTLSTWEQFERHHRDAFLARITEFVERGQAQTGGSTAQTGGSTAQTGGGGMPEVAAARDTGMPEVAAARDTGMPEGAAARDTGMPEGAAE